MKKDTLKSLTKEEDDAYDACAAAIKTARAACGAIIKTTLAKCAAVEPACAVCDAITKKALAARNAAIKPAYDACDAKLRNIARRRTALKGGQ